MMHAATLLALTSLLTPQDPAPTTAIQNAAAMPSGSSFAVSVADLRDRDSETANRLRTSLLALRGKPQVRSWLSPLFEIARDEWNATESQMFGWLESGFSLATTDDSQLVLILSTDLEPSTELPRSVSIPVGEGFAEAYLGRRGSTIVLGSDIEITADALDQIGSTTTGLAATENFQSFSDHVLVTESMEPLLTMFAPGGGADGRTSTGFLLTDDEGESRLTTLIGFGPESIDSVATGLTTTSQLGEMVTGRFATTGAGPAMAMRMSAEDWLEATQQSAPIWSQAAQAMFGDSGSLTGAQASDLEPFVSSLGSFVAVTRTEAGFFTSIEVSNATRFAEVFAQAGAESTNDALVTDNGLHLRLVDGALTIATTATDSERSASITDDELSRGRTVLQNSATDSQVIVTGTGLGVSAVLTIVPQTLQDWFLDFESSMDLADAELRADGRGVTIRREGNTNAVFELLQFASDRFDIETASRIAANGESTEAALQPSEEADWIARLREVEAEGNSPEALASLLSTPSDLVNARAAWLLAQHPDRIAAPALAAALQSDSKPLRQNAMIALCGLKKKAPIQTMREALEHDDVTIRGLAAQFLGRHGQAMDATLLFELIDRTDVPGPDRTAAILALADRRAAQDVVRAASAIESPSDEEERALAFALQSTSQDLGSEDELASLLDLLAHDATLVRRYAIERLGQLGDPRAVDSLERRLGTESDALRPKVEAALTASRGVETTQTLPNLASEDNLIPVAAGGGVFVLALVTIFLLSRRRRQAVLSSGNEDFGDDLSDEELDAEFDEDYDEEYEGDFEDDLADDAEFWPEDEDVEDGEFVDESEFDEQRR
ncbi:MAG: HEAT repeat domain-containing protein [Planctomycetota bacterium]